MIENAGKGCKTSNFGLNRGGGGSTKQKVCNIFNIWYCIICDIVRVVRTRLICVDIW